MKNAKCLSLLCAATLTVIMTAGCGSSGASGDAADYSNQTVYALVESVEGSELTLEIGEVSESSMGQPDGEAPDGGGMASGEAGGEAPSDAEEGGGEAPSDSEGGSGETPSDVEEGGSGEAPSDVEEGGGEAPTEGSGENSEAPEKPDGEAADGGMMGGGLTFTAGDTTTTITLEDDTQLSESGDAGQSSITVSDVEEGDIVEVTFGDNNTVESVVVRDDISQQSSDAEMGNESGSSEVNNGTGATTYTEDTEEEGSSYESTAEDENAVRIENGAEVTLTDVTVEKTEGDSSSSEDSDFYGLNAGALVYDGATLNLSGATVTTTASGGNGVFAYGEGTVLNISDTTIRTTENNSGGIETAGGATTNATNLDIETDGNSSAAIRSDRGGGTVNVDGGTYKTNGTGSPAVYSTADITVSDATLTATASEAIVVEGENSVTLVDCDVTGSMDGTYGEDSSENIHNVMIYQSMSGDAETGNAEFSMTRGSLTAEAGDMFYVTNTSCNIYLEDVDLTYADGTNFLTVSGNDGSRGWGTEGSNGGSCVFTAVNQILEGAIYVDDCSSLELSLTEGTDYTGAINEDGEEGEVAVTLDADSTWTLTGDSYITSFDGDLSNVDTNGYTLYINGEAAN